MILKQYESLAKNYQRLADTPINAERLDRYLGEVFPTPKRRAKQGDRSFEASISRTNRLRVLAERLFEHGQGNDLKAIGGTLWAAYNGVTELVDHHYAYRNSEHRMESVCFGEGERVKHLAFDVALRYVRN